MPELDQTKAERFTARMVEMVNGAMLTFMTSIGHQTRLFDALAEHPAATSEELARAAGVNERYVREWLAAMVTGRIVDYDPARRTYTLPPEHAAALTRAAGTNNIGPVARIAGCLGAVEGGIVGCFRQGGGLTYADYATFHEVMADMSGQVLDQTLIDVQLPLVPGLVPRLEQGIDVLDVGCGSGHAINLMARAFPQSRFTGSDFSTDAVAAGEKEARAWGLTNARFVVEDAASLRYREAFDFITAFDAIHDQAKPAEVLAGIARALRPDGTFLMVDIAASSALEENLDHPLGPYLYAVSTMHCMSVSLAFDGAGLGTMWGEQKARAMLADAGFAKVDVKRVEGDAFNSYYIATRG